MKAYTSFLNDVAIQEIENDVLQALQDITHLIIMENDDKISVSIHGS